MCRLTRRWRRQSRANSSLSRNSLASREFTGNFIDSGLRGASMAAKKGIKSERYEPIPYASEQGIFCGLAGNLNQRSGKFLPSSGNPLSSAIWTDQSDPPERSPTLPRRPKRDAARCSRSRGPRYADPLAERAMPRSPSRVWRRGGVGRIGGRIQRARTGVMPRKVFVSTAIPLLT
jgi:hypothetical protein